jgi:hypothetical protein
MEIDYPSRDVMIEKIHSHQTQIRYFNRERLSDNDLKLEYYFTINGIKQNYDEFEDQSISLFCKAYHAWINKDYKNSFNYYKKSADLGFELAYIDVADCYYKYNSLCGIKQDKDLAIEYYARHLKALNNNRIFIIGSGCCVSSDENELLPDIMKRLNYENYKNYCKISNSLKEVIPINGLIEIILQYI